MTLRELLQTRRDKVLDRFVLRVRETGFADGDCEKLPRIVLLDGLPRFLDRVIEALAMLDEPVAASPTQRAAIDHGIQRQDLGFELTELVREYGILHDVILEIAGEETGIVALNELRLLSRHISAGAAEAAEHFVRARDDERQQLQARHIGFLAHELRTKLNAAVATMSWWRHSRDAAEMAVRTLDESLNDLTVLVDGELASNRLEQLHKGMALAREPAVIAELFYMALKDVRSLSEARGVTITSTADPTLVMPLDARLVRTALVNLIANAVKSTPGGGRVELRARRAEGELVMEIEDRGDGIPEAFAEHGIGLTIARQAIEAHGGTISADRSTNGGSVFTVHIPLPSPSSP